MRKLFIFLLFCLIAGLAVFCVCRYYANSSRQSNWFNEKYRAKLAKYPLIREMLGLHWDGDGRADYLLDDKFKIIRIELDRDDSCVIPEGAMKKVTDEIETVTGKPEGVEVVESDTLSLAKESYSASDLRAVAQAHKQYNSAGSTAALYILCANSSSEAPNRMGSTIFEDGIIIFSNQIFYQFIKSYFSLANYCKIYKFILYCFLR